MIDKISDPHNFGAIIRSAFYLGIDGISLFFVILTTLLIPICILASWDAIKSNVKEYMIAFLFLEAFVIAVFCVLDLILFYVFFEAVLIPMFIIIGVWGSRERKVRAAYMFFIYTLLGSVLMLLAILLIYFQAGTTDYQILLTTEFSHHRQKIHKIKSNLKYKKLLLTLFPLIKKQSCIL